MFPINDPKGQEMAIRFDEVVIQRDSGPDIAPSESSAGCESTCESCGGCECAAGDSAGSGYFFEAEEEFEFSLS
jgi:hypothetical protein